MLRMCLYDVWGSEKGVGSEEGCVGVLVKFLLFFSPKHTLDLGSRHMFCHYQGQCGGTKCE